jgi:site-specific recombinase XerD
MLALYLDFQREHRGLRDCRRHRAGVREFLDFVAGRGVDLARLGLGEVDAFLAEVARRASTPVLQNRGVALRGFLRFAAGEGWMDRDLSGWVETPRTWRESTLPPHFTWAELEQLVASVRGDEALALRDRALLALLCCLGLRAGEAAALKLEDVEWEGQRLWLTGGKRGVPVTLPLMPTLGRVLQAYVEGGRPTGTPFRELLLSHRGRPLTGATVSGRLRQLTRKAGLGDRRGAHAVRRAVGTRLVELGWGLAEVAQVLGHASIDSTRVYLRLSPEFLRDVADNYAEWL